MRIEFNSNCITYRAFVLSRVEILSTKSGSDKVYKSNNNNNSPAYIFYSTLATAAMRVFSVCFFFCCVMFLCVARRIVG